MSRSGIKEIISHSPDETQAIGTSWAKELQHGWVLGLKGELGTGKTQLVKGFARALGYTGKVQSPTFALINEYPADTPIYHIDLYRLDTRAQIIGAGLEHFFYRPNGIAVIEWIERWLDKDEEFTTLKNFRFATIEQLNETHRRIIYEDFGA